MCPLRASMSSWSNTSETNPISLRIRMLVPLLTAMPADSWPRCCSEYRPKYVRLATSSPGWKTPKIPHSSWKGSSGASATGGESSLVRTRGCIQRDIDGAPDHDAATPHRPKRLEWNGMTTCQLFQLHKCLPGMADEKPRLALSEQYTGHS